MPSVQGSSLHASLPAMAHSAMLARMTLRVVPFTGKAMVQLLPDVTRLCTVVFREWPHLYEGDGRYDPVHLATLAASSHGIVVIAYDGDNPVGAATGLPLSDATRNVRAPFQERRWPEQRFFYFAESVLLADYRGQGIGRSFFALREAHAGHVAGSDFACFCAVQRPADPPSRPVTPHSLHRFWERQGYLPRPDMTCQMTWPEIGQVTESTLTLMFWAKSLAGAPLPP